MLVVGVIVSYIVRGGLNLRRGNNQRSFGPSLFRIVYFIFKSTEFHVIRTEYQRIIFHFLLIIYHKSPE